MLKKGQPERQKDTVFHVTTSSNQPRHNGAINNKIIKSKMYQDTELGPVFLHSSQILQFSGHYQMPKRPDIDVESQL